MFNTGITSSQVKKGSSIIHDQTSTLKKYIGASAIRDITPSGTDHKDKNTGSKGPIKNLFSSLLKNLKIGLFDRNHSSDSHSGG